MEYSYSLTTLYDGELVSTMRYADALSAVSDYLKCSDFGTAKEYATYNLSEPSGKMHTKNFYRNGKVTTK